MRAALPIRQKSEPDAWTTFHTHSLLGAALLGQARAASAKGVAAVRLYQSADPLLLTGYEGMKAREPTIPKQCEGSPW